MPKPSRDDLLMVQELRDHANDVRIISGRMEKLSIKIIGILDKVLKGMIQLRINPNQKPLDCKGIDVNVQSIGKISSPDGGGWR